MYKKLLRNSVMWLSIRTWDFLTELWFFWSNCDFSIRTGVFTFIRVLELWKWTMTKKILESLFCGFQFQQGCWNGTWVFPFELEFFYSNWDFSIQAGIKCRKKVNMYRKVLLKSVLWLSVQTAVFFCSNEY
jgi:hypothetical protein